MMFVLHLHVILREINGFPLRDNFHFLSFRESISHPDVICDHWFPARYIGLYSTSLGYARYYYQNGPMQRLQLLGGQQKAIWQVTSPCLYQCTKSEKRTTFFSFRKNPALSRLWIRNMRLENFVVEDHSRLCEKHFEEDQFEVSRRVIESLG